MKRPVVPPELTLEALRLRGVIRIGFQRHTPPFSYSAPGPWRPIGYSVDLAHQVIAAIGRDLQCPLDIEPVEVTSATREDLLQTGTIDVECGSTTITDERRQRVAFSRPIFHTSHRIALKRSTPPVAGRPLRITGITGSTSHAALCSSAIPDMEFEFSGRSSIREAFEAWCTRTTLDGMVADEVILASLLGGLGEAGATVLQHRLGSEHYGFMLRQADQDLRRAVDDTLDRLIQAADFQQQFFSPSFERTVPCIGVRLGLDFSEALACITARGQE